MKEQVIALTNVQSNYQTLKCKPVVFQRIFLYSKLNCSEDRPFVEITCSGFAFWNDTLNSKNFCFLVKLRFAIVNRVLNVEIELNASIKAK